MFVTLIGVTMIGTEQLSTRDYQKVSLFIKDHYGITLGNDKRELVKACLGKRLRFLNLSSYHEYIDYVFSADGSSELSEMVDALTTNLTYFMRESAHFDFLKNTILPQLIEKGDSIRMWCTASSTGEEPYTLSMFALEAMGERIIYPLKVLGTDISHRCLKIAEQGVYENERLKELPPYLKAAFFLKGTGDSRHLVKVKPILRDLTHFKKLNLIAPFPFKHKFDVIFCRNVLIYFDPPTQKSIVDKLIRVLKPGGYLFLGMSEGMAGASPQLRTIQPSIYSKIP